MERNDGTAEPLGGNNAPSGSIRRPELTDRKKSREELQQIWPGCYGDFLQGLESAKTTRDFINIVSASGYNSQTAKIKDLKEWNYNWLQLKHRALVKATTLAASGPGIDLEIERDLEFAGIPRLSFVFDDGISRYVASASIPTMVQILGENSYQNLYGQIEGASLEEVRLPESIDGINIELTIGAINRFYALGRRHNLHLPAGVFAAFENIAIAIKRLKKQEQTDREISSLREVRSVLLLKAAALRCSGSESVQISRVQHDVDGNGGDRILCVFKTDEDIYRVFKIEPERCAQVYGGAENVARLLEPYDELDGQALGKYMGNMGKKHRSGRKEREKRLRRTLPN